MGRALAARVSCALACIPSSATCVFPDVGVGAECEEQSDCLSGVQCVRLDPEDEDEGNVCLPMLELDAPQACVVDDDCAAAGFPVDAVCDGAQRCTCEGAAFQCDFDEVIGEHTCRCLPAGLDEGEKCEDDTQCVTARCGAGECVIGDVDEPCDDGDDCISGTCTGGACE